MSFFKKKHNIKVSIIVPAYNTEKYIEKCLISLTSQTIKDIEIIVINDGSCDNTGNIISSFAKNDSRIKIINQNNLKQSYARNKGMEIAKGEYIGFVDSDDWIDTDYYEKLYNGAKKYDADIALASYMRIGNGKTKKRLHIEEEGFYTVLQDKFDACDLAKNPCPTNKIYRRKFLTNHNITWPVGHYFEDKIFVTQSVYYANGVVSVPDINYYYYRNPNSTVNNKNKRHQKKLTNDKNYSKREVLNFLKNNNAKIRDKEFWAIKKDYKIFNKSVYRINESINTEKHLLFSYIPIYECEQNKVLKNLVVGAGFSGATLAYLIAEKLGENVTISIKKTI